eukprot:767485-Hanusia_phi.AAC.3
MKKYPTNKLAENLPPPPKVPGQGRNAMARERGAGAGAGAGGEERGEDGGKERDMRARRRGQGWQGDARRHALALLSFFGISCLPIAPCFQWSGQQVRMLPPRQASPSMSLFSQPGLSRTIPFELPPLQKCTSAHRRRRRGIWPMHMAADPLHPWRQGQEEVFNPEEDVWTSDHTYVILEGREIRGPVSTRSEEERRKRSRPGPTRGRHRWMSKPSQMAGLEHETAGMPLYTLNLRYDLPVPEPGPGEVLVRVHTVAVNELDVYHMQFANSFREQDHAEGEAGSKEDRANSSSSGMAGRIPGTEFAGTIVELGGKCTRMKVGDEVWGSTNPSSSWRPAGSGLEFPGGACAEYVVVKEAWVSHMPDCLDWVYTASAPVGEENDENAVVALNGLRELCLSSAIKSGKKVLIVDADSCVGCYAVQA